VPWLGALRWWHLLAIFLVTAADAIAEQLAGQPTPASDAQAQRYVADHPYRFSQRPTFILDALALGSTSLPWSELAKADMLDALGRR
jgi:hypothetical protein